VVGPNCLGIIDTQSRINATFAAGTPPAGNIAFFSQSGALCTAILDWAVGNNVGFSKFISLGNKADTSEVDFIEASGNFRPGSYLRDIVRLRRWARERAVDVVHLHRGVEHWLAAAAWPLHNGPAIVRSRHILRPVRPHFFNRWLYRRGTDRVVAVCERIRQGYLENDLSSFDRLTTVMGGVDVSAYDPEAGGEGFRSAWRIPPGAWVVGVAGGVRLWIKGQDVLLRAVARMAGEGGEPPWVVVIGQGEETELVRELASGMGIAGRTVVTGYLDSMAEAFAACNALAFPSRQSEGTSRVLFEYLAAGRPVVASRVGCVEEIVREGQEGFIVPAEDEAALAGALGRLRADPVLARRMGEAARRRAEEAFDRRVMARRMTQIYREISRFQKGSAR